MPKVCRLKSHSVLVVKSHLRTWHRLRKEANIYYLLEAVNQSLNDCNFRVQWAQEGWMGIGNFASGEGS